MNKLEKLTEYLENLYDSTLVAIHNEYCDNINDYDSHIYEMYEFDDMLANYTPYELATKLYNSNFNPNDDYFTFNGYDNLESSSYIENLTHSLSEIVEYMVDNDDDFDNADIREILDGSDEE